MARLTFILNSRIPGRDNNDADAYKATEMHPSLSSAIDISVGKACNDRLNNMGTVNMVSTHLSGHMQNRLLLFAGR